MLADALGRPLRFIVTAGQVGDITQAPALLNDQTGQAILGNKAYDSKALRAAIAGWGPVSYLPGVSPTRREMGCGAGVPPR